jgi:hypothetical protein
MLEPEYIDLTRPFEMHGDWWRQGAAGKTPGCLSYTPEHGLQLQLYGSLVEDSQPPWREAEEFRPIWGEIHAFAGREVRVSLFDEIATNKPNDPKAPPKPDTHDIFFINRAIVGTHVHDIDSLNIKSVEISVPDLESFVGTQLIAKLPVPDEPDAIGVVCHSFQPIKVALESPPASLSLISLPTEDYRLHRGTLSYEFAFNLELASCMQFKACMKTVFKIINFLALCSREPVRPRRICGYLESGEPFSWVAMSRRRIPTFSGMNWLMQLEHIGRDRFPAVISEWFSLSEKLGLMGDVMFSEFGAPSPINDARFFHLAGCLEAYHRDVVKPDAGKFLSKPEYKKIATAIMNHVPTEFADRPSTSNHHVMAVERRAWKSITSPVGRVASIPASFRSRLNMLSTLRLVSGKTNSLSCGSSCRSFTYSFSAAARSLGIGTSPAVLFFACLALIEMHGGFSSR